jgi:hypothetical protein
MMIICREKEMERQRETKRLRYNMTDRWKDGLTYYKTDGETDG